jgi:hypothetical protein
LDAPADTFGLMRKFMGVASAVMPLLVLSAPASAADVGFAAANDAAGRPTLSAWASDGSTLIKDVAIKECADAATPSADCRPVMVSVADPTGTVTNELGTPAPGTVYEASYGGAVGRTPAWLGQIANVTPPAVFGVPVVGGIVSATPGTWSGGWDAPWSSQSWTALLACPDTSLAGCWYLTSGEPVILEPRWAGWYLYAHETRVSMSNYPVAARVAGPFPYTTPVETGVTKALSGPAGPIAGPATRSTMVQAKVPAAPIATVRARALRAKGQLSVARVTCETPCTVKLTVSGGGKTLRRTVSVAGTKALTIPPRHGKLKVRVVVDGKTVASGRSVAR